MVPFTFQGSIIGSYHVNMDSYTQEQCFADQSMPKGRHQCANQCQCCSWQRTILHLLSVTRLPLSVGTLLNDIESLL